MPTVCMAHILMTGLIVRVNLKHLNLPESHLNFVLQTLVPKKNCELN